MIALADTHVHIYPCQNPLLALQSASQNFSRLEKSLASSNASKSGSSGFVRYLFLTERFDCDFFHSLANGKLSELQAAFPKVERREKNSLVLYPEVGAPLFIIAGRQIISADRLEILALGLETKIADGGNIDSILAQIRESSAIPVLNWAPGKWLFRRGKVIERLVSSCEPNEFFMADVSLRPQGTSMPALIQLAEGRGFRTLAGSDPLPFAGEERRIATFATSFDIGGDLTLPYGRAFAALNEPSNPIRSIGRRGSPLSVLGRLVRNEMVRRLG